MAMAMETCWGACCYVQPRKLASCAPAPLENLFRRWTSTNLYTMQQVGMLANYTVQRSAKHLTVRDCYRSVSVLFGGSSKQSQINLRPGRKSRALA